MVNETKKDDPSRRDALSKRLESIAEKNHPAVILFAARSALRVFPLLASQGNFNYWDKGKQAHYLLVVWRAVLSAYSNDANVNITNAAANAASAAFSANAAAAANAAVFAAFSTNAASAADSASAAANAANLNADDVINSDLKQVGSFQWQNLFRAPLWPSQLRDDFNQLAPAIDQLIDQTDNVSTKKQLRLIPPIYSQLLNGTATLDDVRSTLMALGDYLDGLKKVADESEGLQTSVDDVDEGLIDASEEASKEVGEESNTTKNTTVKSPLPKENFTATSSHAGHQAASDDALNREQLIGALAGLIADPDNSHHQTIGLLGNWGAGKSTVVQLLKKRLLSEHEEQPFLFADFNAWEYEHTDNLQAGIAQEMIDTLSSPPPTLASLKEDGVELSKREYLRWAIQRIRLTFRFATAIHGKWILNGIVFLLLLEIFVGGVLVVWYQNGSQVLAGLGISAVGVSLWASLRKVKHLVASNPLAKEFLTYLKLPSYAKHLGEIPVMRKNIKNMCDVRLNYDTKINKSPARLLYVVDDLDRCNTENIVKVFDAVRLVLDIPQVIVIIAIDQRIALSALALNHKKLEEYHPSQSSMTIARDYLSKIIHLPITLSDLDEASVSSYLNHLWEADDKVNHENEEDNSGENLGDAEPVSQKNDQSVNTENIVKEVINGGIMSPAAEGGNSSNGGVDNSDGESKARENEIDDIEQTTIEKLGMSKEQKNAFEHWVNVFSLTNPRQLKRLDNSYKLLRRYHNADQQPISGKGTNDKPYIFPVMMTLFSLEYVNDLVDADQRLLLKKLIGGKTIMNEFNNGEQYIFDRSVITEAIFSVTRENLKGTNVSLVSAVEPFVLPAIDVNPVV
jgi:hypothetical protein